MRRPTLITPMNDSLVDFDMLARLYPATGAIKGPSVYAETGLEDAAGALRQRLAADRLGGAADRMTTFDARNKCRVAGALQELARRIGFRMVPGFSGRVVFRELFLAGPMLLDLRDTDPQAMTMSNIAARQEVRDLAPALELPAVSRAA